MPQKSTTTFQLESGKSFCFTETEVYFVALNLSEKIKSVEIIIKTLNKKDGNERKNL